MISADRPVRAVDGLITGWHDQLISAVAGEEMLERSYATAHTLGYHDGHEFGDFHLILPSRP